jgi:hypothetical protein
MNYTEQLHREIPTEPQTNTSNTGSVHLADADSKDLCNSHNMAFIYMVPTSKQNLLERANSSTFLT